MKTGGAQSIKGLYVFFYFSTKVQDFEPEENGFNYNKISRLS
jgi:hypothetical protein